jgi:ABC-type dipeptide/oligopeptide/nickel transport system permease subunit
MTALIEAAFSWTFPPQPEPLPMNAQVSPRQIYWPSVVTVISAAILIGAEVFGAAFAGGWALAILFGLDDFGAHILQAVLFGLGVVIMIAFIRAAQRVEPFTRRG